MTAHAKIQKLAGKVMDVRNSAMTTNPYRVAATLLLGVIWSALVFILTGSVIAAIIMAAVWVYVGIFRKSIYSRDQGGSHES